MSDSLSKDIPLIEAALSDLKSATRALQRAIIQQEGWAYYWYEDQGEAPVEITDFKAAREAIAARVAQLDYQTLGPKRVQVGAIAVPREILALAKAVNRQKVAFDELRQDLRAKQTATRGRDDVRQASKHFRQCLKVIGEGRLDLSAASRKIPVLPGTALRLRWHYYNAPPSAKKAVSDVVSELQALLTEQRYNSDEEAGLIQSEIARLSTVKPDLPVACRLRETTTKGTRYSGAYTLGTVKEYVRSQYAANPVFFLDAPGIHPSVSPFPKDEISERNDRKRISDERVTRAHRLSHYYWYLQPKPKKPAPTPGKSKNPYASTGFPGLSFWARPSQDGLTPHIRVLKSDGRVTQLSIDKHGYHQAWERAAALYAQGRSNITEEAVIANQPPANQYQEMLAWAMTKV